jgi:glycosyltransferase involved in cell wall biosynthesis
LKRGGFSTPLDAAAAAGRRGSQQAQPLSDSRAPELDRPIHVLILIPTLNVGGAEMDLVRTVPRIDRARFRVTICTFLERGELSELMRAQGIEVIGPFSPLYHFRLRLRRMAKQLLSLLWSQLNARLSALRRFVRHIHDQISSHLWAPLAAKLSALRQRIRRIARPIRRTVEPMWAPLAAKLSALRQRIRRIARPIRRTVEPMWAPLAAKLTPLRWLIGHIRQLATWVRLVPKLCVSKLRRAVRAWFRFLRTLYSPPRAIVYLVEIVRIARPIALYIRTSGIDVVHTILPNSYLVGACAAALAGGRPLLMSRLSLNLYQQEHKLIGFIERRILHRTVDSVIGNSNAVLRDLTSEGVSPSKLHLVYNGIDVRGFANEMVDYSTARRLLGISNGAIVFTVVANLHPYKGHKDVLHSLAALSRMWRSDWLCLFVGKDVHDYLPELKRLCAESGLSRNVEFLGPRADIPIILSAADIHISASHQEGLPNNIIEAMCARLPVVATAVGGVPELVVHGQTGYLLPPQNVDRMTDALAALVRAPPLRKAFGEAGFARVTSQFNIDDNVLAFESIYAHLNSTCHRRGDRSCRADLRIA